jgi:flagellar biosynthesis chaperone FliJ
VPVSSTLKRLLQIRELQEQQSRTALEIALREVRQLEDALNASAHRERSGRQLVCSSAQSCSLTDRIVGLEEIRTAADLTRSLAMRLVAAEKRADELREHLLSTRAQRRQAEILIQDKMSRAAEEETRREQLAQDDIRRSTLVNKRRG